MQDHDKYIYKVFSDSLGSVCFDSLFEATLAFKEFCLQSPDCVTLCRILKRS